MNEKTSNTHDFDVVSCKNVNKGGKEQSEKWPDDKKAHEINICGRMNISTVIYDTLIPEDVERHLIEDQDASKWKSSRQELLKCVEKLLSLCMKKPSACEPHAGVWANFVKSCALEIEETEHDVSIPHLIVIDDNMYYSSMRYQYFQLARKYEASFAEVLLHCSLETALLRNGRREQPVLDTVIQTMQGRLEAPDPSNQWEKYSTSINTEDPVSESSLEDLLHLIQQCLADPVVDIAAEQAAAAEESRAVSSSSILHQADQVLRRLVAQAIRDAQGDMNKSAIRQFAGQLSKKKNCILSAMREGRLTVPEHFNQLIDASRDKDSELFQYVEHIFHKWDSDVT